MNFNLTEEERQKAERIAKEKKLERRGFVARLYSVDDIVLTDEERERAYQTLIDEQERAKSLSNYWQRVKAPKKQKPQPTASDIYKAAIAKAQANYKNFVVDNVTQSIYKQIALYLARDKRSVLDIDKGLLLRGNVGCGKTTAARIFSKLDFKINGWAFDECFYHIATARQAVEDYDSNGVELLFKYNYIFPLMIDDLGCEKKGRFYGKEDNVLEEIIYKRYDGNKRTHFTTNLNDNELAEKYGVRIRSRLYEMCNVISWGKTTDRRMK